MTSVSTGPQWDAELGVRGGRASATDWAELVAAVVRTDGGDYGSTGLSRSADRFAGRDGTRKRPLSQAKLQVTVGPRRDRDGLTRCAEHNVNGGT